MSNQDGIYPEYPIFKWMKDEDIDYEAIWNIYDLIRLKEEVEDGDLKEGRLYRLMENIDMNVYPFNTGEGWTPIGNEENPFRGILDGMGYAIENLYSNRDGICGLFGYSDGAVMKRIIISNARLISKNSAAGALVVMAQGGSVDSCHVSGFIMGAEYVGGIIGTSINQNIKNCFTVANIQSKKSVAGGIAGFISTNQTPIYNCYVSGNIKGNILAGGIAGKLQLGEPIINCVVMSNSIQAEVEDSSGKIIGYYNPRWFAFANNYALNSTLVNGKVVYDETPVHGIGVENYMLLDQSFYTEITWDFDNVWKKTDPNSYYRGYPIFQWMDESFTIDTNEEIDTNENLFAWYPLEGDISDFSGNNWDLISSPGIMPQFEYDEELSENVLLLGEYLTLSSDMAGLETSFYMEDIADKSWTIMCKMYFDDFQVPSPILFSTDEISNYTAISKTIWQLRSPYGVLPAIIPAVPMNGWRTIALHYDMENERIQLYFDGQLCMDQNAINWGKNTGLPLRIGTSYDRPEIRYFTGKLRNLKIFIGEIDIIQEMSML